jgi:NitT/TauT family transport system substrate-binding protein
VTKTENEKDTTMKKLLATLLLSIAVLPGLALAQAQKFNIAWSHYTGWEPWGYAQQAGILDKWAKKYGIQIELTLVNDYMESVNLYTSGKFQGVAVTNMDALTVPAAGGVDTTALIIGDFSNGNDGIVVKNGASVRDLKGRTVNLVELSVSHYLLARALSINGLSERDVKVVNTSDADIASVFTAAANGAAVTWNPPLQQARNAKGATLVFDSSKIPGEIIDLLAVRTNTPDSLKKALTGAWYETMAVMSGTDKRAEDAVAWMAKSSGATPAEFRSQLKTTAMFYRAEDAVKFATGEQLKKTMEDVRSFSFSKGLFGQGAKSKDAVGMQFPDGSVIGNKGNVRLRFDATFMRMAAEGKL